MKYSVVKYKVYYRTVEHRRMCLHEGPDSRAPSALFHSFYLTSLGSTEEFVWTLGGEARVLLLHSIVYTLQCYTILCCICSLWCHVEEHLAKVNLTFRPSMETQRQGELLHCILLLHSRLYTLQNYTIRSFTTLHECNIPYYTMLYLSFLYYRTSLQSKERALTFAPSGGGTRLNCTRSTVLHYSILYCML